jgi:hypothetical protein
MTRAHRVAVPTRAIELAGLAQVNYADCFQVDTSEVRTPEEWIRLAVGTLPALFSVVRVAHRMLGLHLAAADSPDHIIGWDIARSDDHEAVLHNAGRLGEARIIGITTPGQLQLATVLQLDGVTGSAMWTAAAPLHRTIARYVLGALPRMAPTASIQPRPRINM